MEKQWTEKQLMCTILNFINRYERLPDENDFCEKNGLLALDIYYKFFNMSLYEIFINYPIFRAVSKRKKVVLYETGWNRRNNWTAHKMKCAIENFINCNGYFPRSIDFNHYNQLPSFKTFLKFVNNSEFE